MKKRTYKRMQNRLYREIKRRIEAENTIRMPIPVVRVSERRIERLGVRCRIPSFIDDDSITENAKKELARELAKGLLENGYVAFRKREDISFVPCNFYVLEGRLNVCRPFEDEFGGCTDA